MTGSFSMGTTSSITMQSLAKIVQRTPCVGAKTWFLYVFLYFCHVLRTVRCSFEGCIVRTSIALLYIGRFRRFFQNGLLFQAHYLVLVSVASWRHNLHEIAVKNFENPKIGGKVCVHDFLLNCQLLSAR